jgi:hypothetical protein
VIDALLSLPPTSVNNETTLSRTKLTKGKRRGNLKTDTLKDLVQVEIETPSRNTITEFFKYSLPSQCSLQDWINISLNVTKLEDHMTYRFVTMFTRLEIKKYIYDYKTIEFHSYNL